MTDYPDLPDFLNRKLNPGQANPIRKMSRGNKRQETTIIWPGKKIEAAIRKKRAAEKKARKEKKRLTAERERRG